MIMTFLLIRFLIVVVIIATIFWLSRRKLGEYYTRATEKFHHFENSVFEQSPKNLPSSLVGAGWFPPKYYTSVNGETVGVPFNVHHYAEDDKPNASLYD